MTLSPEPPGIFRFGLAPARSAWLGAPPGSGHTCRLQGHIGARGASPQSSILGYGMDTLPSVDPGVNYSLKLYFHIGRAVGNPARYVQRLLL